MGREVGVEDPPQEVGRHARPGVGDRDARVAVEALDAHHHAAAAGDVASLRLLVEHGADLDAVDPGFGATPLGWAEFFEQQAAAEYLRSLSS